MIKYSVWLIAAVVMSGITACRTTQTTVASSTSSAPQLASALDSVCYAIGVSYGAGLGANLKTFPGGEANFSALETGFLQAIKGDSTLLNAEAAQAFIQSYFMELQRKDGESAKETEKVFLEENKTKEGVVTTESGLQYKILTLGNGPIPVPEEQVKVHYTGKLLDGKVFDSSVERGEPVVFGVTQVIPGWTEALQLMPVGSKFQVWIPSALAYGEQGMGQAIKPNSLLEFEIELLEIVETPANNGNGAETENK
ncbi:MAG: FKBP-type peptidyl-prolyl cis-trans isomerase [Tannerella sp.]|jgi:FKBP-type peptidyl-prolyl cis-trans isomerase|nr:FKBP-type peptidyl-prolyl cis-trans isomerase [Tannerella sp.]